MKCVVCGKPVSNHDISYDGMYVCSPFCLLALLYEICKKSREELKKISHNLKNKK